MSLAAGTRLGPYEIVSPIGAGGMGEVYRARDASLQRDVAIKVLPAAVADDPDRLARFEREAQALAALNHPNIAQVYGLDTSGTTPAIVMELVDGPTLADRITQGPMSVAEALPLARQIIDALDAAHQAGIVHRDLKPANVKVREDGTVKVLDFGLAKALGPESALSSADGPANSPTLTARATEMGMILGTAAYMAPEQAKGRSVDRRADIWAFGAVLYEMVTGARAFAGEDVTETLASVVRDRPDLGGAPVEVRRLLEACLEKNPKDRLRDIGDACRLLESAPAADQVPSAATPPSKLPWLATAAALVVAGVLAVLHFGETAAPVAVDRFAVEFPGATDANTMALSPDGRHLASVVEARIWVRSFDALEARPIERTEGATYPFWSPDSASIGFFADGQLKTVPLDGGPVQSLAPVQEGRGGAWSPGGTILFSPDSGGRGLFAIPDIGGDVRAVTTIAGSGGSDVHRYPQFLPDGDHFVYLHLGPSEDVSGVYVGSLAGGPPVRVLDGRDQAIYAAPVRGSAGHLLFRRGDILMAQPFDPGSLALADAPFSVAEGVGQGLNTGSGAFSVSGNGRLAYGAAASRLVEASWHDRSGARLEAVSGTSGVLSFTVSHDEQRAAIGLAGDPVFADVWLQDLGGGSPSRFTFGPSPGWFLPVWAPDDRWVAYATIDLAGLDAYEIRRKPADMSGNEETLLRSDTTVWLWDWSPAGNVLVYEQGDDIVLLPLDGDRTPAPFLETPHRETYPQVSPDGRWMAYASDEGGEFEVYVRSIPATDSRWQLSTGGGTMPRWRRDGRELYYRAADGTLTAIDVRTGPAATSFEYLPTPKPLFAGLLSIGNLKRFVFQPSADGQRFAALGLPPDADISIAVVVNWQAGTGR